MTGKMSDRKSVAMGGRYIPRRIQNDVHEAHTSCTSGAGRRDEVPRDALGRRGRSLNGVTVDVCGVLGSASASDSGVGEGGGG